MANIGKARETREIERPIIVPRLAPPSPSRAPVEAPVRERETVPVGPRKEEND